MNEKHEEVDGAWLDCLDEIVDGVDEPAPDDDELLQLARQMHVALAPFRELDAPARAHRQRLKGRLHAQLARRRSWKRWVFRPLMVAAALLLFILLGPGLVFELNPAGQNNHITSNVQGWYMPDLPSTESYQVLSLLDIPQGQKLLMPTNLLPNAYLLAINTNTYGADISAQSYLVYEQNALIYESPSPPLPAFVYSHPSYQTLYIGNTPIFVTHTSDGSNRLEWYQDGLLCDFVSNQPLTQLLEMVRQLQPVTY
ncbi:MAG: hypothetical protein ACRDIV_01385 [Ktedonobacteraceae bacterium]